LNSSLSYKIMWPSPTNGVAFPFSPQPSVQRGLLKNTCIPCNPAANLKSKKDLQPRRQISVEN
jgi:hypothetical protein